MWTKLQPAARRLANYDSQDDLYWQRYRDPKPYTPVGEPQKPPSKWLYRVVGGNWRRPIAEGCDAPRLEYEWIPIPLTIPQEQTKQDHLVTEDVLECQGWYFWSFDGTKRVGPYKTKQECADARINYCIDSL